MDGSILFPWLCSPSPVKLTVWRSSLLFNGDGYTVYNNLSGELVFRVENYAHNSRNEAILMDFAGEVLLTIRRNHKHKFGISKQWEIYKGDASGVEEHQGPLFIATKLIGTKTCELWSTSKDEHRQYCFRVSNLKEANFHLAEASRKFASSPQTLLGKDVMNLQVEAGVDQAVMMAIVMIIDAMHLFAMDSYGIIACFSTTTPKLADKA